MARQITTEVQVRASAERVWAILTDFESYPSWNPFIREISGSPLPHHRLVIRLQGPGASTTRFRPRVLVAERPFAFRWLGRLGIPGLFDGEHSFEILPGEGGGVLFRQSETFRGLLVPLVWRSLERHTRPMFVRMNEALRARAEV